MTVKNVAIFILLTSFCKFAISANNDVEVDVDYISGSCSENFAMFKIELTNNTNEWVTISNHHLDFGGDKENKEVAILIGKKLAIWAEANDLERRRSKIKSNLLTAALGIASITSRKSSKSNISSLGKLGSFLAAGSLSLNAISSMKDEYRGDIFPSGHFLKSDIMVPPNLALIRWVLVNTKNNKGDQYITKLTLDYDVNGKPVTKTYHVRNANNMSISPCNWQDSLKPEDNLEGDEF